MKYFIFTILFMFLVIESKAQRAEATITRTTSTNSVFPRQFPEMTIRQMSDKEYYVYESLNTNTIFHRQFPTYIIRKENYGTRKYRYGVYRTLNTNTVFHTQFPDRYVSDLSSFGIKEELNNEIILQKVRTAPRNNIKSINIDSRSTFMDNGYTYSNSLRSDGKRAYSPEVHE